jgi:hypothetical protein
MGSLTKTSPERAALQKGDRARRLKLNMWIKHGVLCCPFRTLKVISAPVAEATGYNSMFKFFGHNTL